jgi:hypothetical protein
MKKMATVTKLGKLGVIFSVMTLSLGNQSCEEVKIHQRELKRRIQMGAVKAPHLVLPQGGFFDFQYVANAQLYDILRKTQAFSTATIDPAKVYDPSGLNQNEVAVFHQCEDSEEDFVDSFGGTHRKTTFSKIAACMIDMPQGIVSGHILDFTLTNQAGLHLKFNEIANLNETSFTFQKYELSVTMKVMHPLQRGGLVAGDKKVIVTTSQQKYSQDYGIGLNLNFMGFELGPSYYYRSPLRKVVDDALTASIEDLKNQWNQSEPWYAMVLRSCDKYIYINAGNSSDAGLKIGDLLRIQNVNLPLAGSELSV